MRSSVQWSGTARRSGARFYDWTVQDGQLVAMRKETKSVLLTLEQ